MANLGRAYPARPWISKGPIAGSAAYNADISESASASDAVSAAAAFQVSVSEAATATDAVSSVAEYLSSISEITTASDATNAASGFHGAITESASAVDAVGSLAAFGATIVEAGSLVDVVTGTPGIPTAPGQYNYFFQFPSSAEAREDSVVGPYLYPDGNESVQIVAMVDFRDGTYLPQYWLMLGFASPVKVDLFASSHLRLLINTTLMGQHEPSVKFSTLSADLLANLQIVAFVAGSIYHGSGIH